tara:strand:+ start:990 stop:1673 length:684 start_codon:yes stop_codon:yes gene_type:complete
MAYGIKVFSANGAVQLDSTDANQILYQEFASGTSSAATGASSGDFRQITVSVTGFSAGECLVFIRPTGTVTGVKAYVMPGSNGFSIFTDTNRSFYWYVFKKASSLSTPTGYGLVVYASDGTTVQYNSDVLSARIKGRLTGTGSVTGSNLFGMGTFQYTFANARLSPNRGFIKGYRWEWTSTGIAWAISQISPFGASYTSSDNQATREDMFYFNISMATALVVQAPNP